MRRPRFWPQEAKLLGCARYLARATACGGNMITLGRNHNSWPGHYSSLSARAGFWPGFQQLPLLANHSLVICGRQLSCPRTTALLQPRDPETCLCALQARTFLRPVPQLLKRMGFHHAQPARTHAHALTHTHSQSPCNAACTRAQAWPFSFCARFAGRCSCPRSHPSPLSSWAPRARFLPLQPLCPRVLPSPFPPGRGGMRPPGLSSGRGWNCRAGLRPAPCLFSLRPLNARLRRKDYPGRIMPGVNTRANKSACTTRQPRWDPGRRLGERTRSSLLITNK